MPDHKIEDTGCIKYMIRSEYVPTTTLGNVSDQTSTFMKLRHSRADSKHNVTRYGHEDVELKADNWGIEKHDFKCNEIRTVTDYFLKN